MTNKYSHESSVIQKGELRNGVLRKRKNRSFLNEKDIVSSSGDMEQTLEDLHYVFSTIPGGSFILNESLNEGKKNSRHNSTISSKIQQKTYNSLSKLESDLAIAATSLLNRIQTSDSKYALISSFYTFSRKLLAREQKYNTTQTSFTDPKKYTQDLFPSRSPGNECLFIIGPNGPLFSSFAAKSVLDTRPINTGHAYTTQVIPNHSMPIKSNHTFASISPPLNQSESSVLKKRKLLHPILRRIPSIKWLYYDSYSSYAPTKDMETAIFSESHFNAIWCRREKEKLYIEQIKKEEKDIFNQSNANSSDILELDEKLIFSYEPMVISDDLKTFSSTVSKEDNDINMNEVGNLIQILSEMQSLRIARSRTEAPGEVEERLAFHIQQLLLKQIIAFNIQPKELLPKPLLLSMSFLVLGPSYSGTLSNMPLTSSAEELRNQHGSYSDFQNYVKNENISTQVTQRMQNFPVPSPSLVRNDSYRSFLNPLVGYGRRLSNKPRKY
ncbi:hypothetical protein PCANB_000022 [Pneumocystis canis]|nr:hypothetical protein PCANB_000022 [Pneumocystis canis]